MEKPSREGLGFSISYLLVKYSIPTITHLLWSDVRLVVWSLLVGGICTVAGA